MAGGIKRFSVLPAPSPADNENCLVLWLPFLNGDVSDYSGQPSAPTAGGAYTPGISPVGPCVTFPGSVTAPINVPIASASALTYYTSTSHNGGISFSCWINAASLSNAYSTIFHWGTSTRFIELYVKSTGKLAFYFAMGGSGSDYDGTGTITLSTNGWYHVAVSAAPTTGAVVYINALQDDTVSTPGATVWANIGTNLNIGYDNVTASRNFVGSFADFRVYNRYLTLGEISNIYHQGMAFPLGQDELDLPALAPLPTAYNKAVAIAAVSSLAVIKAVSTRIGMPTNRVTENGNLRVTEDGNQRVTEAVSSIPSTSALSVSKSAFKVVAIASASAVSAVKGLARVVSIASASAVNIGKLVGKIFAVASSSAVAISSFTGATRTQLISIASASAVSILKHTGPTISIASTSALSMAKAITHKISVSSSSAVSALKQVAKTFTWTTISHVTAGSIKAHIVAIAITCSSAVRLTVAVLRGVLVDIATVSTVTVIAVYTLVGEAVMTLVGSAATMLLRGFKKVLRIET